MIYMTRKRKFDNKGVTLIELLVASTIVIILSVAIGFAAVRFIRKSRLASDANTLNNVKSAAVTYYTMNMEGKKTSWEVEYTDGNGSKQKLKFKDVVRGGGKNAQEAADRNKNIWPAEEGKKPHKFICFYMDKDGRICIDPPNDMGDTSTGGSGSVVKGINAMGGVTYSKCSYSFIKNLAPPNASDKSLYRKGVATCLIDIDTGETRVGWNLYWNDGQGHSYYDLQNAVWNDELEDGIYNYR